MERSTIESDIINIVVREGPLTFEELGRQLPLYTWNQVFGAVDRLSRQGLLALRRADRFTSLVCLNKAMTQPNDAARPSPDKAQAGLDLLG